jgi:hypothetical protein
VRLTIPQACGVVFFQETIMKNGIFEQGIIFRVFLIVATMLAITTYNNNRVGAQIQYR